MEAQGRIEKVIDTPIGKIPCSQEKYENIVKSKTLKYGYGFDSSSISDPAFRATLWYDNTSSQESERVTAWRSRLRRDVEYNVKIGLIKPEDAKHLLETMPSVELDEYLYKLKFQLNKL